jgi:hypothetical protein
MIHGCPGTRTILLQRAVGRRCVAHASLCERTDQDSNRNTGACAFFHMVNGDNK